MPTYDCITEHSTPHTQWLLLHANRFCVELPRGGSVLAVRAFAGLVGFSVLAMATERETTARRFLAVAQGVRFKLGRTPRKFVGMVTVPVRGTFYLFEIEGD